METEMQNNKADRTFLFPPSLAVGPEALGHADAGARVRHRDHRPPSARGRGGHARVSQRHDLADRSQTSAGCVSVHTLLPLLMCVL